MELDRSIAVRGLPSLDRRVAPLIALLRLLARLPLGWYHAAGAALGWIVYRTSSRFANRLRENLRASGVCADEAEYRRMLRENIRETGKQALEFIPLWFRSQAEAAALVRRCTGEDAVQRGIDARGAASSCSRRTWGASRSPRSTRRSAPPSRSSTGSRTSATWTG